MGGKRVAGIECEEVGSIFIIRKLKKNEFRSKFTGEKSEYRRTMSFLRIDFGGRDVIKKKQFSKTVVRVRNAA